MRFNIFFFVLLQLNYCGFAQKSHAEAEIEKLISNSVDFLVRSQYDTTDYVHFKGEWHSTMGLSKPMFLFTSRADYEDSNSFMLSNTHNHLAALFLSDTSKFKRLGPVLHLAFGALEPYRMNETYNFWHAYLHSNKKDKNDFRWVRRPSTYPLHSDFLQNAANLYADVDDIAAAYTAFYLQHKIDKKIKVPLLSVYANSFVDLNRQNYNWYNWISGIPRNTGAFLTFTGPEYHHKHPGLFQILLHTGFFLLPKSASYPHFGKSYMPYGTNDVDLIVNLNVLSYLALNDELLQNPHAGASIKYVQHCLSKKNPRKVIIYYPNNFQLPYNLVNTYASGLSIFEKDVERCILSLLQKQKQNGCFASSRKINHGDKVQSTANALYAMLFAGNFEKLGTKVAIEKAVQFLIKQKLESQELGTYWKGGVFFSGGTVIKNRMFFKSDAYTTALIVREMQYYLDLKKQGKL